MKCRRVVWIILDDVEQYRWGAKILKIISRNQAMKSGETNVSSSLTFCVPCIVSNYVNKTNKVRSFLYIFIL